MKGIEKKKIAIENDGRSSRLGVTNASKLKHTGTELDTWSAENEQRVKCPY